MKKTIIFKTMLVSMALVSLSSCYDMDEMSKNPYELPDNTTGGGEEQPGEEDNTKYADINIDYKVSKEDSLALKSELSSANSVFRNFLYEGFFNDYQITTNLSHDIYAVSLPITGLSMVVHLLIIHIKMDGVLRAGDISIPTAAVSIVPCCVPISSMKIPTSTRTYSTSHVSTMLS